jgi:Transposase IS66 family
LRAGRDDYVINPAALDYMRDHGLPKTTIGLLSANAHKRFAGRDAFMAHLKKLGLIGLKIHPDPVQIASEGAAWGSIAEQGLMDGTVIVSDGAGQFDVGDHALCWVHAERLIHKLDTFCEAHVRAKELIRHRIWWLYADLKAYRHAPTSRRASELRRRFSRIFSTTTGFATLDRLLARLHAQKKDLLAVLVRPEIPLHTNSSENDIRCHVTRRKISAGTRSDPGRDCRDAFLGLMKTCAKHTVRFWDYLGDRLGVPHAAHIPRLAQLISQPAPA